MKLAVWSGPRNLSTAMMYAFGNRADFAAWDEPFYAAYLDKTGLDHPMRQQVLSHHIRNADEVAKRCSGAVPDGKTHWYMKHMAFHMCDGFYLDWAESCINIHLIRHPARVIASYEAKRENPTLDDIGFRQQVEIFQRFPGPVLDSVDIRNDPERMLRILCDQMGLSFTPDMLRWPAGPKPYDGIWASHWYGAVHCSTGFAGAEGPLPELSGKAAELEKAALPYYEEMRRHLIR